MSTPSRDPIPTPPSSQYNQSEPLRPEQLRRFRAIVEELPIFIAAAETDGTVTFLNKTAREWAALDPEESTSVLRFSPDEQALVMEATKEGSWQGTREKFLSRRPGAAPARTVVQTIAVHRDDEGDVQFYYSGAVDISRRRRLERERLRLLSIVEETPDFVATATADGRILYLNKAARRILNIDPDVDLDNLHFEDYRPAWVSQLFREVAFPAAIRDGQWEGETAVVGRDGREIPMWQVIVAHKNAAGEVEYLSTVVRNIEERKRWERQMQALADYDSLTGALQRRAIEEQLGRQFHRSMETGGGGALLLLDLDKFKAINDRLGHHAGDFVLQHVVRVVEAHLRPEDAVGRIGGDEFVVLLADVSPEGARRIAERLLARLTEEPVDIGEKSVSLNVSIGLALFPGSARNSEDLLQQADAAMYAGKRAGGNRVQVHGSDQDS